MFCFAIDINCYIHTEFLPFIWNCITTENRTRSRQRKPNVLIDSNLWHFPLQTVDRYDVDVICACRELRSLSSNRLYLFTKKCNWTYLLNFLNIWNNDVSFAVLCSTCGLLGSHRLSRDTQSRCTDLFPTALKNGLQFVPSGIVVIY